MNGSKTFIYFIFSLIALKACGPGSTEEICDTVQCEQQLLYDQVIELHDEVMPKLSQISTLKSEIEAKMEASGDSIERSEWLQLMLQLDEADESMWVWMRQFKPDMDSTVTVEDMAYLETQLKEVAEVAQNINGSIERSKKALE